MSALLSYASKLHILECYKCKQAFAICSEKYNRATTHGEDFHCPDGHSQIFTESEKTKHEKELAKIQQRLRWAEESRDIARRDAEENERRARAFKGVATKIKKRVGNGVCPCCNRTFANLMNHMAKQHPDFKEGKV